MFLGVLLYLLLLLCIQSKKHRKLVLPWKTNIKFPFKVPISYSSCTSSLHSTQQHMLHSFFTTLGWLASFPLHNKVNKIIIGFKYEQWTSDVQWGHHPSPTPEPHTNSLYNHLWYSTTTPFDYWLHQGIHLIISRFEQFLCLGRFSIWICLATVINPPTLEQWSSTGQLCTGQLWCYLVVSSVYLHSLSTGLSS